MKKEKNKKIKKNKSIKEETIVGFKAYSIDDKKV